MSRLNYQKYSHCPRIVDVLGSNTNTTNAQGKKTLVPLEIEIEMYKRKKLYWEKRKVHWELRATITLGQNLNAI